MTIKTFILVGIAALALACSTPKPTSPDEVVGRPEAPPTEELNRGTLWYGIAVHDERLEIAVRLIQPPEGITRFFLPGKWAGRDDHADFLSIGEASGPDGPAFMTIDRANGRVDIETPNLEWVELRYAVDLERESRARFRSASGDGIAVLFGPTFLVLPSQQVLDQTRDIPIEVHAPDPWNVMSTWSPIAEKASDARKGVRVHGFVARDGDSLRDAFLVTGPELKIVAPTHTAQTTVGFSPRFSGDVAGVASLVGDVLSGYRREFGSLGPTRVFVDASDGDGAGSLGGVGRRGGFVLNLPADSGVGAEVALLVAHEALHLWNGHHLVPQPDSERSTRWFKEGVTHYLAIKYAVRLGLVDFEFASGELAEIAANYQRNPRSSGRRGREIDRARFPYDQGALLALEVDASLARASNGAVGVEDWLRELDAIGNDDSYNRETLGLALRRIAEPVGSEAPEIMRRHLDSVDPIDLRALFHRADLHWLPSERSRAARLIALDREAPLYSILFHRKQP